MKPKLVYVPNFSKSFKSDKGLLFLCAHWKQILRHVFTLKWHIRKVIICSQWHYSFPPKLRVEMISVQLNVMIQPFQVSYNPVSPDNQWVVWTYYTSPLTGYRNFVLCIVDLVLYIAIWMLPFYDLIIQGKIFLYHWIPISKLEVTSYFFCNWISEICVALSRFCVAIPNQWAFKWKWLDNGIA